MASLLYIGADPGGVGGIHQTALDMRDRLGSMPLVVRETASGSIVGTTRYCNVDEKNRRLEIGYTWYAQRAQRSAINTECKAIATDPRI